MSIPEQQECHLMCWQAVLAVVMLNNSLFEPIQNGKQNR